MTRAEGRKIWRVGRKLGRTLYVQRNPDVPDFCDDFVGMMDTPELAQFVCDCVNAWGDLHSQHPEVVPQPVWDGQERCSVDPDDTCGSVVPVDGNDSLHALPEDDRAVPPVPPDADLPVVERDPLGDDTDTRDS